MSIVDKRAALFEYFKKVNSPKWASDGARLYKTLKEVPDAKIDQIYARMLELEARAEGAKSMKKENEALTYKSWKIPLIMFFVWGGAALYFALDSSAYSHLIPCMFYSFIAGSYFQEFIQNGAHNIFDYRRRKKNEKC